MCREKAEFVRERRYSKEDILYKKFLDLRNNWKISPGNGMCVTSGKFIKQHVSTMLISNGDWVLINNSIHVGPVFSSF